MNYKVETIPYFRKRAKRLIKKFPSLKKELADLGQQLSDDPMQGNPLGYDSYKIRLSIKSKNKGKSGGARVITHIYINQSIVYLLDIYDKSEQSSITDKELKELVKLI
jgi:mRNA-degrading endonuclease RelE of RelBE toxin-antitoxin system